MHLITYCHDTAALQSKGLALVAAGKYKHLICKTEEGRLNFKRFFVPVAYNGNKSIGYGRLSHVEIYGDAEEGIPSFLDEMGLIALFVGENRSENSPHNQLRRGDNAQSVALYKSVIPMQDIVDAEGNPTGEKRLVMIPEVDG